MTDETLQAILGALGAMLTIVLPILTKFLVSYLNKKLKAAGLEATSAELEAIRKMVEEGVSYAAQRAKVKVKGGGEPLSSQQKKDLAPR